MRSCRIEPIVLGCLSLGNIPEHHLVKTGCCFPGALVGLNLVEVAGAGCRHLIQQMSDQQALAQELEGQKAVPGQILADVVPEGLAGDPGSRGRRSMARVEGLVGELLVERTGR